MWSRCEVSGTAPARDVAEEQLRAQVHDLHEQLLLQRQVLSHVSHELRTPLSTIRMAADVLFDARDQLDPNGQRAATLLTSQLDRFEALLNDLLELARHDAGTVEFVSDEVDITPLVANLVVDTRGLAQGVSVSMSGPRSATVCADRRRVERILRNLIANAVVHGGGSPVHIMITLTASGFEVSGLGFGPAASPHADTRGVLVEVADCGVGLPAHPSHMFERFWRADPARARDHSLTPGVGLGLALAAEDTILHGGALKARTNEVGGATFSLWLPQKSTVVAAST